MSRRAEKLFYKRKCKSAQSFMKSLIKSKVGVHRSRFAELSALDSQTPEAIPEREELRVFAVNFSPDQIQDLYYRGINPAATETVEEKSWKTAVSLFGSPYDADVIFLNLQTEELQEIERSILGLCFVKSFPAVVYAKAGSNAEAATLELTASTVPVFTDMQSAVEYLKVKVHRVLFLRQAVQEDIAQRVARYKKAKVVKHFGTRAAVALVPFAVSVLNLAEMVWLVKRLMKATGMVVNKKVAGTLGKQSAVASLKIILTDQIGDLYSTIVGAAILVEMGSAFAADGLTAAFATLSAVDFALLGSVSVVTGAMSALGSYMSRPQLVTALSKVLANLQVVYLLNPNMRLPLSQEECDDTSSDIEEGGEDVTQE